MEFTLTTHTEDETIALGDMLGRLLRAGDCIALVGELGAGKTRFVRGVAQGLNIDPRLVNSPTYVIVNEYEPAESQAASTPLVHLDAYRLADGDDLSSLGWSSLEEVAGVVVVEWADRIASAIPPGAVWITIEHTAEPDGSPSRRLVITGYGSWDKRLRSMRPSDSP
jgi:tRNA threonylcarbamoyladenosine biosynthesis protein TsaE